MGKRRFIGLHIQADYPLKSIKPNIYYVVTLNKEEKRYTDFFILNGNIYFETAIIMSACERTENYYCCTIEKLKRFVTKVNISQFFKCRKKMELETVSDLLLMAVECGYKREIHFHEFYEAEEELKSDFSSRYKFDDFKFAVSIDLNPPSHPGDALITKSHDGAEITLDMISDERKQPVPDCIKDEIAHYANTMLEENLIDIKDVRFLLHAKIEFEVIGTLYRSYRVEIIMIGENRTQLHKVYFCLCDCEKEQENAMEEYFKNELFPDKVVDIKGDSANGTKQKAC